MSSVHPHPSATSSLSPPTALHAFVDESMRRVDEETKYYLMAAAVVPGTDCERIRDTLRPLLLGRSTRLHWRDERATRRQLIAKTIGAARVESLVVVGAMLNHRKEERARQLVMRHLLHELDRRSVSTVLLESRHPDRDRHDLATIGGFRNARLISRRLTVSHGYPVQEPLLWVPDAVAGAAGEHRTGDSSCYQHLDDLVALIDLGII